MGLVVQNRDGFDSGVVGSDDAGLTCRNRPGVFDVGGGERRHVIDRAPYAAISIGDGAL
jgi:hypothetical protein